VAGCNSVSNLTAIALTVGEISATKVPHVISMAERRDLCDPRRNASARNTAQLRSKDVGRWGAKERSQKVGERA